MTTITQIVGVIAVSAVLVVGLVLMTNNKSEVPQLRDVQESESFEAPLAPEVLEKQTNADISNTMNPIAVFTTNKGIFEVELYADQMPITTKNFIKLAEDGFYDGTKFHRVIDGFMIQGGDPNSKTDNIATYGQGGPGYTIQDEFVSGENLTNTRGSIAMANTGQPNSGGSQFFINTVDNTGLDFDKPPFSSKHPVFGRVVSGMEVVDAISSVTTGPGDVPVDPVVIESVIIRNTPAEGQ